LCRTTYQGLGPLTRTGPAGENRGCGPPPAAAESSWLTTPLFLRTYNNAGPCYASSDGEDGEEQQDIKDIML